MHRAAMNGGFEKCCVGMILRDRHGDGDGQTDNASRSVCAHFLMDHDFHACEIEFFAQTQQLVLGGRIPSLRAPRTKDALAAMVDARLVSDETARDLCTAYDFLRGIEHRIQMLNDEQTHKLPLAAGSLLVQVGGPGMRIGMGGGAASSMAAEGAGFDDEVVVVAPATVEPVPATVLVVDGEVVTTVSLVMVNEKLPLAEVNNEPVVLSTIYTVSNRFVPAGVVVPPTKKMLDQLWLVFQNALLPFTVPARSTLKIAPDATVRLPVFVIVSPP
mgnify:CR=1 FL=1